MLAYTFYEVDFRVMRYAEALASLGDQVSVIALRKRGAAYHEVINGVNLYRIQCRTIDEKGKFTYLFRILRFLLKSFWFISCNHLKIRYDLIHVHNVPDFLVFAAFIPKIFGTKIILDIHDILPEFYASKFSSSKQGMMFKIMKFVEKLSVAFSDHVIVSNHLWKEKIIARSAHKKKCTALINFVDQTIFYPRKRDKKRDEMIMLYPGTVNWHQGLDIAVNAFAKVKDDLPKLNFHIYGTGSHIGQIKELIDSLGLDERVIIFPPKSLIEISEIIASADFGIIPKRNDQFGGEAFSTKTLEFMSCGVPIILSKTRIDNFYYNDTFVQFFEPGDINSLANSMRNIATDENLKTKLTEKSLEFVKGLNWNLKKKKYVQIVNNLCG